MATAPTGIARYAKLTGICNAGEICPLLKLLRARILPYLNKKIRKKTRTTSERRRIEVATLGGKKFKKSAMFICCSSLYARLAPRNTHQIRVYLANSSFQKMLEFRIYLAKTCAPMITIMHPINTMTIPLE